MTSTRLPGKVLKTVLGRPLLEIQIERLKRSKKIQNIIIATTINPEDAAIVELCKKLKVDFYRGSEMDVLDRYYQASLLKPTSHVIRVTSDCPLIDPAVLDLTIEQFEKSGADYFSNSEAYPIGMNAEIFSSLMLAEAHTKGLIPYEREHVTPYFYTHPELFKLGQAVVSSARTYPKYRLTVDTPEDFALIKALLEGLMPTNKNFSIDDICDFLAAHPDLADINSHVRQKKFTETQG